jgi:tellurite resistance protein TerC
VVPVNLPALQPPPIAALGDDPAAIFVVITIVILLLLVDFFLFARDREPTFRESVLWSIGWLILGVLVAIPMALYAGGDDGVSYLTVYLIERTLSLDNLVVFLLIFGSFAVPQAQRGKLLFWGIILALVMRGAAIVVGVGLIERFHIVIYILGVGLLVLAWKMWTGSAEHTDPHKNPFVKLVSRRYPVSDYEGAKFSVKRDGKRFVTPMALALVAVVAADIAFAIDSIPAAFAITDNALVIWTANGFALLGLRALFALVEELVKRFRYLNQTVAIVLGVVAVKLLIQDLWKVPAVLSLAMVVGLFAAGIWLSIRAENREGDAGGGAAPPSPQPSSAS